MNPEQKLYENIFKSETAPKADISSIAKVLKETYDKLIAEGFTEAQAMEILKTLLIAGRS